MTLNTFEPSSFWILISPDFTVISPDMTAPLAYNIPSGVNPKKLSSDISVKWKIENSQSCSVWYCNFNPKTTYEPGSISCVVPPELITKGTSSSSLSILKISPNFILLWADIWFNVVAVYKPL